MGPNFPDASKLEGYQYGFRSLVGLAVHTPGADFTVEASVGITSDLRPNVSSFHQCQKSTQHCKATDCKQELSDVCVEVKVTLALEDFG